MKRSIRRLALAVVAASVVGGAVNPAAAKTWTGAGGDGKWSTGANWGGTAINGTTDSAVFAGTTNLATSNDLTGASVASISFSAGAGAFTLDGNAAKLAGNVTNSSTNTQTINIGLNLTAGRTFTTATGGGNLIIGGNVAGDGTNNYLLTLAGAGAGTINGSVTATGITLNANTNWTLNAANTFSGVTSGTVDTQTFTTGVTMTNAGASLTIGNDAALGNKTFLVGNGASGTGPVLNVGGTGTRTIGNQIVTNNSNFGITGNDLKVNGQLLFGGTNQITVNNNTTFSGGVAIRNSSSGTGRTATFAGSGVVTIDSAIVNGADNNASFAGAVMYAGSGTLKLSGNNTYTGLTTVSSGGTLVMNGTHNPFNTANSTVTGGAYSVSGTLAGTGTINPSSGVANVITINSGGTLSPGDTTLATAAQTGTLDLGNSLVFAASATNSSSFNVQLGGVLPGDGIGKYDQVNVTSTAANAVSLGSGVNLNLSLVNNFTPAAGEAFYFLTRADSTLFGANAFYNLPEGTAIDLGSGVAGYITYKANWTGTQAGSSTLGGNDVALVITAAPEPASLALIGLAGLGLLRRRR